MIWPEDTTKTDDSRMGPRPRTSIEERLNSLSEVINAVEDSVGRVVNKIGPVLDPDSTSPASLKDEDGDSPGMSEIASRIESATKWLQRINYGLINVADRIEL